MSPGVCYSVQICYLHQFLFQHKVGWKGFFSNTKKRQRAYVEQPHFKQGIKNAFTKNKFPGFSMAKALQLVHRGAC